MSERLNTFVGIIAEWQMKLAMVTLGIIVPINLYEILVRYFFNKSLIWIQEVSVLLMVWMIFCGFTKIVYEKKDITIDLLTRRFSAKMKLGVDAITQVIVLAFVLIFTIYGYRYFLQQIGIGTLTAGIPRILYIIPVVLNSASVTLIYFNQLLITFTGFRVEGGMS